MAGIDQNTLWKFANMILGKSKAQPTTRERATFLRTDSDGTQWVRLPSSNDETPVNGRTLATAKAGDTVEWSIDNGRLSITGNSTSPSVGRDYVGQEVSVVTKQVNQVKADVIETNELLATKATITELEAESARIDSIEADVADIDTIRANSAKVQNLTAAQLEADHAKVGQLDVSQIAADHATIGNLDTTYMHANMSNSDVAWIQNGTIRDGAIVSAMINDVSANKLTAGTINGSVINVTNLNADNITAGTINGQRIGTGSLSLDKLSEDVYTESEVNDIVDDLNDRIDGAIETHTGTAVPTLNNQPASSWNTTALKDEHVGDVYYVVNSQSQQNGYCYRFTKSGSTYSWQLIKDSDVTAALSRLNTAEGKITSIESFDSTVSSFMTNTNSELTSVKSRATSLETRMTDAEGDISEKVNTSTFNTLSQTVDENSASITSMGTVISNNGLTSSTNITNTVNTVSQTATGNSSKITQLTTTLGTNADGTTKTGDVMHRTSAVEQDLSGFKTTVSQTYATNTTVDGIATRVSTAESNITQNANNIALKVSESDVTGNYVVGKINLNSTTASIAASHINLQGAVTISDLAADASNALTNAAKTATNYVTDITGGGVMVHPSDDATSGVRITSDVDIMRDDTSVINIGTNDAVRIGRSGDNHLSVTNSGMSLSRPSSNSRFDVGLGPRTAEQNEGSSEPITEVPVVHELEWTPQQDSIRVLKDNLDRSFSPPSGEVTYAFTLDGKEVTLTDARLVGYRYLIDYTATDFSDVSLTVGSRDSGPIGRASTAFGYMLIAAGEYSHAEGNRSNAEGTSAHAEGLRTKALDSAHAEGAATTASGYASHAEGVSTTASGYASHAEGNYSEADGLYSHAEGRYTKASGYYAHAQNQGTQALANNQTAIGRYNLTGSWAFIIGNGTDDDHRSNALTVDWDGNVACAGTVTAQGRVNAESENATAALVATDAGSVGVSDSAAGKWVIRRDVNYGLVLGSGVDEHLYARASTVTTNTTNVTQSGDNHCWNNGAVCSFVYRCAVKSALANGSELAVGTLPANYRPPYDMAVEVYTSTAVCVTAKVGTNGTITVKNVSGSSLATSVLLRISGTFAL